MKLKLTFDKIVNYQLIIFKSLGAVIVATAQVAAAYIGYAVFDILSEIYRMKKADKKQDLSDKLQTRLAKNQQELKESQAESAKRFEQFETEQKEFQNKLLSQKTSAGLLNKLINEGFIRESDLLKLAGSYGYYQVIVYSIPVNKLVNNLESFTAQRRKYPIFLQELGFVRLGKSSSTYLINKRYLHEEILRNSAAEFKKFLKHHFSRLRKEEWKEFLDAVKEADECAFQKLSRRDYKSYEALRINFLLTEMSINLTNIGYVDDDVIGIADVKNDRKLTEQLLFKADPSNLILSEDIKVRIREIMLELDIMFLLDGVVAVNKRKISASQSDIKQHLSVNSIIDFYTISIDDLSAELQNISISDEDACYIAKQIISEAEAYNTALNDLGISLI